jgi:hypothetical protein
MKHRRSTKLHRKQQKPKPKPKSDSESDLEGEGIIDYFKPRDSYNNTSKRTIATFGSSPIVSITLSRAPIQSFITKALDLVSFGKFSKLQQKYGFDRLFHLSMIADIEHNGARRKVTIEKNAVINISSKFKSEADAEFKSVPMKGSITLSTLMDKTQAMMGSQFFPYNAFNNNCQVFINDVLKANHLLTPELHEWLFQNVDQIASELPSYTKAIANAVTTTGAVADKLSGGSRMDALILESIKRIEKRSRR